jgi:hypothetical protein
MSTSTFTSSETSRLSRVGAGLGRIAAGAGVAAMLFGCSPVPALAESVVGTQGTTQVTVEADENNLRFEVPTVIPFVAASDGTLTGPTADATRIKNLSVFGIKVTNVKVTANNGWNHSEDVQATDDSINWTFGPSGAIVTAAKATGEGGLDITSEQWNMTYQNDSVETDEIKLETAGTVGRVATDISSPVHVGTVTFTVAPGKHGVVTPE